MPIMNIDYVYNGLKQAFNALEQDGDPQTLSALEVAIDVFQLLRHAKTVQVASPASNPSMLEVSYIRWPEVPISMAGDIDEVGLHLDAARQELEHRIASHRHSHQRTIPVQFHDDECPIQGDSGSMEESIAANPKPVYAHV